jgi:hypothetical protein
MASPSPFVGLENAQLPASAMGQGFHSCYFLGLLRKGAPYMRLKFPTLLLWMLILLAAGLWPLLSASAQQRVMASQPTAEEVTKTPLATRQPLKIQRFSIPYGKHRQGRRYQSLPPSMNIDYRRVMPLPESGHNYLKDYYGNHH